MFANALKMDAAALFSAMSPSKTCKVRVSSTRYRNDPYRARVAPFVKPVTPVFVGRKFFNAPAAIVPLTATAPATQPASTATTQPPSPVKVNPAKVAPLKPAVITKATAAAAAAVTQAAAPIKKDNASKPPQTRYALVGFKHEASMFQAPFRVAPGDIVVVEADRGEHIGVVQSITTTKPKYNVPSSIVRRASRTEAASIDDLTTKESKVTASVQKLAESFGLGIKVLDTEFQFDQNKLTVFFNSKVFVDFRKLQRSLFREHRCRIWLVNWAEVRTYTPVPVTMPSA